ncbi:hypothetical protein LMG26296_04959 [Cupriavidus plantarum]|nr:hypothetical protein LMG26296_04959 [Cupriavidus plantarum]
MGHHIGIAQDHGARDEQVLLVLVLPKAHDQPRVDEPALDLGILEARHEGHVRRHLERIEIDIEVRLARVGKRLRRAVERQRRAIDLREQRRTRVDRRVVRQVRQERQRQREILDALRGIAWLVLVDESRVRHRDIADREPRRLAVGWLRRRRREALLDVGEVHAALRVAHHAHGELVHVQAVDHRREMPQRGHRGVGIHLA